MNPKTLPYPATIYQTSAIYFCMHGGRCSFWSAEGLKEMAETLRKIAQKGMTIADGIETVCEMIESTNADDTASDTPPVRKEYASDTPPVRQIIGPTYTKPIIGGIDTNDNNLCMKDISPNPLEKTTTTLVDGGLVLKRRDNNGK